MNDTPENDKEYSAEIIPFNRNKSEIQPTPAQAERLRNIPMTHLFEFYDYKGEPLVRQEGILNIGPDFAAVTDINNNIKLVVQAASYSYVRNAGPVAQIVAIAPDGGTTLIGSDGGTSMSLDGTGPEVA